MKRSLRNLRNSAICFNRNIIQSKNTKNFSSLTIGEGTPFGGFMRDIVGSDNNPLNNFFAPIASDMLPKVPTLRVDFFETPTEYLSYQYI
jgi:hypothetical protein